MQGDRIYLDHNATTPLDPKVLEAMLPYLTDSFGIVHSAHSIGKEAQEAVKSAGRQIATLIGCEHYELVFTSGGTEAINLAMKGIEEQYGDQGYQILTTATEHRTVQDLCQYLAGIGLEVVHIPLGADGRIILKEFKKLVNPQTLMVAITLANNETGVLQPVEAMSKVVHQQNAINSSGMPHIPIPIFFVDACQAVGRIPLQVDELGIDMMALSAHKFYGPKGVGALYMRGRKPRRVKVKAQIHGGSFQRNMRSGTLNVPAIVGMGKAAEIALHTMEQEMAHLQALRNYLEKQLVEKAGAVINIQTKERMPQVTSLRFEGVNAFEVLENLQYTLASARSSFTSRLEGPSHVLKAIGLTDAQAESSLRLAVGRGQSLADMDKAVEDICQAIMVVKSQIKEQNAFTKASTVEETEDGKRN